MQKQQTQTTTFFLIAAWSLSFCSCQTIDPSARTASRAPVPARNLAPAHPQAVANQANIPQPMRGQPVYTSAYRSPALPHTIGTMPAPMPRSMQTQQTRCPHCSPGGPFRFSDTTGGGGCNGCGDGSCGEVHYHAPDEYLCDGGDNNDDVRVRRDWTVTGLDDEDTVVHYDTLDGRTEVTASNKVCLYAPRFGAVRQVTNMIASEQAERLAVADEKIKVVQQNELDIVSDVNQPLQPIDQLAVKQIQAYNERTKGLTAEQTRHLIEWQQDLLPYENFDLIRRGVMKADEKLRLAQRAEAAIVWSREQAVQVIIDGKLPLEAVQDVKLGETVLYDREGKPRMRIIKIADKSEAQPGEEVSFTLRFDNIGEQKVGNVTIIDNLTTRLEYVDGSQECSHKAEFSTSDNDVESLTLRWEIQDPMRVGEGGIIRFKCRVR